MALLLLPLGTAKAKFLKAEWPPPTPSPNHKCQNLDGTIYSHYQKTNYFSKTKVHGLSNIRAHESWKTHFMAPQYSGGLRINQFEIQYTVNDILCTGNIYRWFDPVHSSASNFTWPNQKTMNGVWGPEMTQRINDKNHNVLEFTNLQSQCQHVNLQSVTHPRCHNNRQTHC